MEKTKTFFQAQSLIGSFGDSYCFNFGDILPLAGKEPYLPPLEDLAGVKQNFKFVFVRHFS